MKRVIFAAFLFAFATSVFAAGNAGEKAADFPPGLFIDGRRYSLADLEGKAVVLFFYEQDCPRCRGAIPERNKIVEQYKDKPVKFIAIAAGDSMVEARGYVSATKLAMPVFADPLSLMEKRYGTQISLQNIWQFRVIGPDGVIMEYRMEPAAIDKALAKVKWKYKDQGYHASLANPIELLEWNQYEQGAAALKPFLKSSKKDVAESASKLFASLKEQGEAWLAAAEKAASEENPVEAFDLYTRVSKVFAGDELAKKAAEPLKKLAATPAVKDELAARTMFDRLNQGAAQARPQQRDQVAQFAQQIATKYPKTPTGMKAAEIAKEIGSGE